MAKRNTYFEDEVVMKNRYETAFQGVSVYLSL